MDDVEAISEVAKTKIRLRSISFSGGTTIELVDDELLVVVGPNNSGKSQFLRDIEGKFCQTRAGKFVGKVVTEIVLSNFSKEALIAELGALQKSGSGELRSFNVSVHPNALSNLSIHHLSNPNALGALSSFFLKMVSSQDRLSVVLPSSAMIDEAETPGQLLYDSEKLLQKVSNIFEGAFSRELFLDYRSGGTIPLYIGKKPLVPDGMDRLSDDYVKLVRECDKLHEQGDGMKSFGGILLSAMVVKYNITLIDEPEAFLHPPQERAVGRAIADHVPHQVVCATHSKNVLQGFLESDRKSVRVARLVREGTKNSVSEIGPDEIRHLWQDPVFRYSTALEALFHERAILCEADADCKFFEAIGSVTANSNQIDTHYIPCGGKAAFPKFISALRKVAIPVLAIVDIDALNNEDTIQRIFEAQGGDWKAISTLWKQVDAAVRKGVKPSSILETKNEVSSLLDSWKGGRPPKGAIEEALRSTNSWDTVKKHGVAAIPAGEATKNLDLLLEKLAEKSIFPIPVGEMESFVPSVGNKGLKWVNEVFENYELDCEKLDGARKFMKVVMT